LERGKLSAALFPFQLRCDTASYWPSKLAGWVYDERERITFCPEKASKQAINRSIK